MLFHIWWKRLTRKSIIMLVCQLLLQKNGNSVMRRQASSNFLLFFLFLGIHAGPSKPLKIGCLCQTRQRRDQPATGHICDIGSIFTALDREGKSVGDDDEVAFLFFWAWHLVLYILSYSFQSVDWGQLKLVGSCRIKVRWHPLVVWSCRY